MRGIVETIPQAGFGAFWFSLPSVKQCKYTM